MEKRKHPKLDVKKVEILKPFRFPSTKFYPRNPISSGKFIKKMENIENNQIFKIKDVEEVVFIIEAFDQTPLSKIDKIIDENFKGKFLLFLSETEFLIRCKKESLDKIIEKYKNKELPKKFQESIKGIKTLNAYDKISTKLRKKLEIAQKKLEITGLLVPGFKKDEYTELIERLKKVFPESRISSSKFISSSLLTFNALGDIKSVENISQQPYIFLISEPPKIDIDFNRNLDPRQDKKKLVREDDEKPNVCIVDSGVDRNAIPGAVLIEDGHPTLHGNYTYSHTHGTEVSSIAALGDDLIFYGNAIPTNNSCNIISYKLADTRLPDPLFSCLYHAITKYKQKTRIFNLSVSYRFHDPLSHYLTNEIDRLVQNENIVLVNSAGNIKLDQMEYIINRGNNYPFYLEDFVCQNPSNAKNVLAISSYALNESSLSICKKSEISPYSAIGRLPEIQDNRLKPNLFVVGGNVEKKNTSIQRNENLGISVVSTGGLLEKRNGTSFSAPYSSYILSHLDRIYSPLNSETLKAILLSCVSQMQERQYDKLWKKY